MAAELKNIANIQDIEGRHSRTTNLGSGTATCYGSRRPLARSYRAGASASRAGSAGETDAAVLSQKRSRVPAAGQRSATQFDRYARATGLPHHRCDRPLCGRSSRAARCTGCGEQSHRRCRGVGRVAPLARPRSWTRSSAPPTATDFGPDDLRRGRGGRYGLFVAAQRRAAMSCPGESAAEKGNILKCMPTTQLPGAPEP